MSANHFNAIVILNAIPDGESNTARRLKEELDDIACYIAPGLQILYVRIDTMSDLENTMADLLQKNQDADLHPLLHLEGHGLADESGFVLANGTPCSWKRLKELITPLNVAMELNLMLVLAACYGGSFATSMSTVDRAPVWGLIGPTQEVSAGQVERSFQTFYKTFFNSLSTSDSLKALNDSAPNSTYFITIAEQFFYAVWRGYKRNMCTEEMIEKRAKAMYDKVSKDIPKPPSIEQLKKLLLNKEEEKKLFEKYRDKFFMYDLYPLNQSRFTVSYEVAEEYIAH